MATTRVNKLDFASHSSSFTFDGGVCDCVIFKNLGNAASVSCGGNPLIKFDEVIDTNGFYHQIWGLQNAPQGNQAYLITGTTTYSSVESYSGVNTTATFPNVMGKAEHHLGSGSLTDIQVDVTTTVDDCILVGLGGYNGSGLTNMQVGSATTLISVQPPAGGDNLSVESSPLVTGVAGTYHLAGTTGGGSVGIVISLIVVALAPGPAATTSFIPEIIII